MDRVSFGQVINLNDYLNGYENIKNKKYEAEVERMNKFQAGMVEKNKNTETLKQEKLAARKNKAGPAQNAEMTDESGATVEEQKTLVAGNIKEIINGEEVTTIVSKPAAEQ